MPVKEIGMGYSMVELDIGNEHLNPFGDLHGGVYASAIDTELLIGPCIVSLMKVLA